jgi:hypothetical protein
MLEALEKERKRRQEVMGITVRVLSFDSTWIA